MQEGKTIKPFWKRTPEENQHQKKKNVVLLQALNISLLESGLTELQVQVQTGLEQRGDTAALPGNIPAKSITWKLLTGGITGAHWAE